MLELEFFWGAGKGYTREKTNLYFSLNVTINRSDMFLHSINRPCRRRTLNSALNGYFNGEQARAPSLIQYSVPGRFFFHRKCMARTVLLQRLFSCLFLLLADQFPPFAYHICHFPTFFFLSTTVKMPPLPRERPTEKKPDVSKLRDEQMNKQHQLCVVLLLLLPTDFLILILAVVVVLPVGGQHGLLGRQLPERGGVERAEGGRGQ